MSQTIRECGEQAWAELATELRQRLVDAASTIVAGWTSAARSSLRAEILSNREDWVAPYHFYAGMAFRNGLRELGIEDVELPSGNLDDYYVKAIELSLGVK